MDSPPAYLTDYLNKIAQDEGFVEHTVHYESGSNHGDGFVGIMYGATIKDKQSDKQLSLMCKLLPENKARREYFNSTLLFDREVHVYNEILPMFEQFQIERNIPLTDGFSQYPKCYFAVANAATDHYAIIMENVKSTGYQLWDKMKPVDFDTSSTFLTALGKFHGLSFALRDQRPDSFKKLFDLDLIYNNLVDNPIIANMMIGSMDKAIEGLKREDEINIIRKLRDNYRGTMKKLISKDAAGQLGVLCHGDCWNNNLSFRSDANVRLMLGIFFFSHFSII